MAAAQPLKIRMVAGLGNPGDEYAETRHNAGFKAIDELARQAGVTYWKNQAGAEVALININDPEEEGGKRQIVLVKPQSYMNTSGGPISKLCREYKIKAEELLVIHDELDIPAGDVRVKVGGGHAGHNGLRSIIEGIMRNVMYDVPSIEGVTACRVTKDVITSKKEPILTIDKSGNTDKDKTDKPDKDDKGGKEASA